jgi:hypothetical protein
MGRPKEFKTQWTTVSFPVVLIEKVRIVKDLFGYTTVADYARNALRRQRRTFWNLH